MYLFIESVKKVIGYFISVFLVLNTFNVLRRLVNMLTEFIGISLTYLIAFSTAMAFAVKMLFCNLNVCVYVSYPEEILW